MRLLPHRRRRGPAGSAGTTLAARGFTLAEVAVTIVIVGVTLALTMQGLTNSRLQAAHTRNVKLARELALFTLSQAEAGLWFTEYDEDHLEGDYSEQDQPDFTWEMVLGDEQFHDESDPEDDGRYDSWKKDDDEDEEEVEQPWEVVRVRVSFPTFGDKPGDIVLERWMDWEAVHGPPEEEDAPGVPTL